MVLLPYIYLPRLEPVYRSLGGCIDLGVLCVCFLFVVGVLGLFLFFCFFCFCFFGGLFLFR